ncbi:hypothetical protein [Vibrio phage vB_VhaP_PG11]|nr:hypothetical protein [Vibrio phage vB_VhaP_PG11]
MSRLDNYLNWNISRESSKILPDTVWQKLCDDHLLSREWTTLRNNWMHWRNNREEIYECLN